MKFVVLLVHFVISMPTLFGQSNTYKPLKIGDKIPNIEFGSLVNYATNSISVSNFKGKLLILDFWATWCSPCVKFFKTADSLQKRFGNDILILPVTYEDKETVVSFLNRMKSVTKLLPPSLTSDSVLHDLFPHNIIPHEIWIDSKGIVKAITSHEDVNEANIQAFLKGEELVLNTKRDEQAIPFTLEKPVLTGDQNIGVEDDELIYHSILTRHKKGLHAGYTSKGDFISCINVPIRLLYQIALGKAAAEFSPRNRTILKVNDTSLVDFYKRPNGLKFNYWKISNTFCYELNIKDTQLVDKKFEIMEREINNYFSINGIHGKLEKRKTKCWVLIRTSSNDKIKSKGGEPNFTMTGFNLSLVNKKFINFISPLQGLFLQNSPIPIIDGTGYLGNVDMELDCQLSDITAINKELQKYDLKFVIEEREIDMIVITQK